MRSRRSAGALGSKEFDFGDQTSADDDMSELPLCRVSDGTNRAEGRMTAIVRMRRSLGK